MIFGHGCDIHKILIAPEAKDGSVMQKYEVKKRSTQWSGFAYPKWLSKSHKRTTTQNQIESYNAQLIVHNGNVVHNGSVLLSEMAANRTLVHSHDLLRKISRVNHLAPSAL